MIKRSAPNKAPCEGLALLKPQVLSQGIDLRSDVPFVKSLKSNILSEPLNDPKATSTGKSASSTSSASSANLANSANSTDQPAPFKRRCVLVCQHRSCLRVGSAEVLAAFEAAQAPGIFVSASDCMGQCGSGPTVKVAPDNIWYCRVKTTDVPAIVEQHLQADKPVETLLHPRFHPQIDAFSPQE